MKRLSSLILALALLTGAGSAFAQNDPRVGPYLVAAVGRTEYTYDCWFWSYCEDARGTTGKIGGGYRFGVFALEGWYIDFGKADIDPVGDTLRLRASVVTGAWYLAFGPRVDGVLRAGAADVRQSRTGDRGKSTFSGYFGLGLVVKLAPAVGFELGLDATGGEGRDSGSTTGRGLTVGIRASF